LSVANTVFAGGRMPYCSKCGTELGEDAKFCPACGTSVGPPVAEPERRRERRPISTLTIALIVLLVAAVIVTAIAAAVFLGFWQPFGRVVGSGNLVTQEEYFSDFTVVEVGSGFTVEIAQSSLYSISITADDNVLDYIQVSRTGDTLEIRLKWGYSYRNPTLRVDITMPELYELRFSGGTHGTIEEFSSSHDFVLELSGGSSLSGDFTTSGDTQFTLSGGSHGSHLKLSDFPVHDANVKLSGGSHATINLDGRLDGDLSGGSHLKYLGNPTTVDVNTSGGSTVGPQ